MKSASGLTFELVDTPDQGIQKSIDEIDRILKSL